MPRLHRPPSVYADLGPRLAAVRTARGWSRSRLAVVVGVGHGTVKAWEEGRTCPSLEQLERLATALNIHGGALARLAGYQVLGGRLAATTPLGRRIRELRDLRGLTQRMLGWEAGINQSQISAWEIGLTRPSPERLRRLADALGADYEELAALAGYGDIR